MPKFILLRYKFSKLYWFTPQRTQSILNNKIVKEPVTLTSNKCQGIICLTWTGPTLLTFYKSYMYMCVSYFSITHSKTKVNSMKWFFKHFTWFCHARCLKVLTLVWNWKLFFISVSGKLLSNGHLSTITKSLSTQTSHKLYERDN